MHTKLMAVLVVFVAAGCGTMRERDPLSGDSKAYQLQFEASYGFCAGYCTTELTLTPEGEGVVERRSREASSPTLRKEFALTEAERQGVEALLAAALSENWDERYGCPDCADQGAYRLTASRKDEQRQTILDPGNHPDYFDALLHELQRIVTVNRPQPQ
jgi:hypothetical protein